MSVFSLSRITLPLFSVSKLVTVALKKRLFKTLSLLNGNCLRHPIPGKWMHALVPNLVFARHHGLLFGLPFLRVVGFFNEHFDPTQVWSWCLRDPGEKRKGKEKKERKNVSHSLRAVVSSVASGHIRTPGTSSSSSDLREKSGMDFLRKVRQQMTNVH